MRRTIDRLLCKLGLHRFAPVEIHYGNGKVLHTYDYACLRKGCRKSVFIFDLGELRQHSTFKRKYIIDLKKNTFGDGEVMTPEQNQWIRIKLGLLQERHRRP